MKPKKIHSVPGDADVQMHIAMSWPLTASCGLTFVPTMTADETDGLPDCQTCYPPKRSKRRRPISHRGDRPHYVYRHYDADGRLIYVGCTNNPPARLRAHRGTSWWSDQIATSRNIVYPDRETALAKEREAIATEQPRWNVKGRWPYRDSWAEGDYLDYLTAIREGAVAIGTYSAKHIAEVQAELDAIREDAA